MSFTERVAELFKARPNQWVSAYELQKVGGAMAWRSRVSDARKPPFGLNIENRVRRVESWKGGYETWSEYRYVPKEPA